MQLAKRQKNGNITLVTVENGQEVGGRQRSEAELYTAGYKKACPYEGEETGEKEWREYAACFVEELVPEPQPEPDPEELTDSEALAIITEGL